VNDFCATGYPEATGKGFTEVPSKFRLLPAISTEIVIAVGLEDLQSYWRFPRSSKRNVRADREAKSRSRAADMPKTLHTFAPIVRKLVEDGSMSCDEKDADGYLHTVPPSWSSASVTRWLRNLEKSPPYLHDPALRKVSVEGVRESTGLRLPRSLPVNFYSLVYLHDLDGVRYAPQPAVDIENLRHVSVCYCGTTSHVYPNSMISPCDCPSAPLR